MFRYLGFVATIACLSACGSSTPDADEPTNDSPCTESECGPAPTMPTRLCEDRVSVSGPNGICSRNAEGVCRYEIRECPATPPPDVLPGRIDRACGGMDPAQNGCAENELCDFPREAMCGAADGMGVCRARPEACTDEHAPVCGCDDRTYPNACAAAQHGVSVGADGECPERFGAAGDTCGTRGVPQCGEGLFCDFPAASNCGRADGPGVCTVRPTSCTGRIRRVCGCNNHTYDHVCSANMAGISVEREGICVR